MIPVFLGGLLAGCGVALLVLCAQLDARDPRDELRARVKASRRAADKEV